MTFNHVNKILVIKLRHIGDVLLTVPVFRALRENFPNAHISALVNSGTDDVLIGNSLIDEILVFKRSIKKQNPIKRFVMELSFLRGIRTKCFDMTINLTEGDRGALVSFISGAKYRIAQDPGRSGFGGKRYLYTHLAENGIDKHMVLRNLNIVRNFGIDTDNLTVDIFVPAEAREFVKKILHENRLNENTKIVQIHPTSRWLFKCWKDEYMAEVIHWLVKNGVNVIITSSHDKKEMDKAKKILSLLPANISHYKSRIIDLCGKTTIKQLAAISETSDLFLGVDTAPTHIAAAVGTPVIALFGTGENEWKPWGSKHLVISRETFNRIGMSREEYIMKNLSLITPDDVMKAITCLLL